MWRRKKSNWFYGSQLGQLQLEWKWRSLACIYYFILFFCGRDSILKRSTFFFFFSENRRTFLKKKKKKSRRRFSCFHMYYLSKLHYSLKFSCNFFFFRRNISYNYKYMWMIFLKPSRGGLHKNSCNLSFIK